MSEEKKEIKEFVDELGKIIERLSGVEVDKNIDKLVDATRDFSQAVEEFTNKLDKIDNKFKTIIDCSVIIDVTWGGDTKIRVLGGGRKHITEVLDELKEQIAE